MNFRKNRAFSLIEILVSMTILVLVSAVIGVKVVGLIGEHRFKSSVLAFTEDLKQLQVLSLSHGSDFSIYLYKKNGCFYYQCVSEADLAIGPLFSSHSLKGIASITIDRKKQDNAEISISSTGRIDPLVSIGFHSKEDNEGSCFWVDLRQPILISLSDRPPSPSAALAFPPIPKNLPKIDK